MFLGFGFSKELQRPIGFKTKTKFVGTYSYASKELQLMRGERQKGCMDFYNNDLHGLWKVVKEMGSKFEKRKSKMKKAIEVDREELLLDVADYLETELGDYLSSVRSADLVLQLRTPLPH